MTLMVIKPFEKLNENQVQIETSRCLKVPEEETHAEEGSEVENLKKALQHYKAQNAHLNDFNDQLIQSNRRLREDLEEINTNYA